MKSRKPPKPKRSVTIKTTLEHLRVLGVDPDHPSPIVEITAPVSGVITDQQVTNAAGVQGLGAPSPFTISDLTHVWIVCDVFENDLGNVRLGETAEIRLNAYPGRVLTGTISNIGPVLDPNIRSAKVRIEVQNPGLMRLGMFVTATFHGPQKEARAAVPATAILHLHDRDWVYEPVDGKQFRRVEVVGGDMLPGGLQEIVSGHRARSASHRERAGIPEHGGTIMIRSLVNGALNARFIVLSVAVLLFAAGIIAFKNLPVEAYPDVANTWVQVITQWPGRAAEEVEQQITVPIEIQVNGIPHLLHVRSASLAGLSVVNLIFDDDSDNDWDRQKVLERLTAVTLPANVTAQIGPDFSPIGSVYWYTIESTNPAYDVMELKSLQDWVVSKYIRSAPDIVDDSSFGGITREYQVRHRP